MIVEGRISAQGDNDHIIRFDSIQDDKLWPGITFASVKDRENKLAFVRIRNARTAVNCQASSPIIELSEFTQNNEAIKIQGAFSKPLISKNAVYKNRGIAISVSDGAAPRILNNSIQDNDNAGLMIHSSATEIAQNTIARNKHNGIVVKGAQTLIRQNNLIDNQPYNMAGEMTRMSVKALDNWWGASPPDPKMIRGKNINIRPYLNKETPDAFKESR